MKIVDEIILLYPENKTNHKYKIHPTEENPGNFNILVKTVKQENTYVLSFVISSWKF